MILYPAIDLLDGACVRLHKGDFDAKTSYSTDPIAVASDFAAQGAEWLHLVDLSGAKDPAARQTDLITTIIRSTGLRVQTGGGVRSVDDVMRLIDAGATRVVIGSLAVTDMPTTRALLQRFGGKRITLAIDVLPDGETYRVATSGWRETSPHTLQDILDRYIDVGLAHILCTDISRDGTMTGPNIDLYCTLMDAYPALHIQASGGVGSINDIAALASIGVAGAIAGKAIYEGKFSVAQGVEAATSC